MPLEAQAQTNRPTEQTGDVRHVICSILKSAAKANDLPVDFFVRLIWQESRFRANAVGPVTYTGARALGIAQFMPGTAGERGLREPQNPAEALPKSSELLAELRHEFGNLGLAAAAYNAGLKRVREFIAGSRSLPQQTRNYVRAITRHSVENWASEAKEDVDRENDMEPPANGNATSCPGIVAMLERSSNRSDRELQQRSVPSWCRSLHHPNISMCGSVHLEETRWSGGLARHRMPISSGGLVKKPQAFRHSVFREELFPRPVFRRAWEALDARLEPRKACRVYVGLLHLAAMHGCEAALADHLAAVLDAGRTPDLDTARAVVAPSAPASAPAVSVPAPNPAGYDRLLTHLGEAA